MKTPSDKTGIYEKGIRFKCTECGRCCSDGPGLVYVTDTEIADIAEFLGMSQEAFVTDCVRRVAKGKSLRERKNWDCWFLKDGKCRIYSVRPAQCRTWPFWQSNLSSKNDWAATCEACPGIGRGRLFAKEEIDERASHGF